MSENNQLPVPVSGGEIINAVANQLSILKKIIRDGKKSVLFVDDDFHVIRLVCEEIHERFSGRVEIIAFSDGKSAYEYLVQNFLNVHLIISNILMPEMDGIQFLRLCKELNPNIPFIIHTSYDWIDEFASTWAAGLDAYIVKNADTTELLNAIEKFLFTANTAQAWVERGNESLRAERWNEARVAFTRAIELKHDDAAAYRKRGVCYGKLDNYQQAINDFKIAARLGDKEAQDWLNEKGIQW